MHTYRKDFPTLAQSVNATPLVYLDTAATSQKPLHVIEALDEYYRDYNSNIHRGIHTLSEKATAAYENARRLVAGFINAPEVAEVIFTRNTTESINLVAYGWGRKFLKAGDVIVATEMEHHSNLVPWHILKEQMGVELRFIRVNDDGTLDLSNLDELLDGAKLVSFMHVSNVLGTENTVKQITQAAHNAGALVLIDGAQAVPNMPVDVQDLGVDFFAFSSHKMCGPTGIGEDLSELGMEKIAAYERELTQIAMDKLRDVEGLRIYGEAEERVGAISFTVEGVHPHDLSTILDQHGVAIRAGHHCAQPLMRRYDIAATARASLYFYNTPDDIDALVDALNNAKEIFGL